MDEKIAEFRAFSRFYTRQIGLLNEHFNDSRFSLPEGRVLHEIAARGHTTPAAISRALDMDPAYATDDGLADSLIAAGTQWDDPLWRMPLWSPYESMISSRIADVNNAGQGGFAGSVTAALFLQRFAKGAKSWVHLDIYGWAPEARPGRPFGGTDQGIRSVYAVLKQRYS